jgi:PleD family two-component response regulator
LPAKTGFLPQDIEVRDVEVMLVMPHGAATRYVEREMQQCGYRTSVVESTLEALHMIIRVKPDFVIVSAMMPELDGIDLVVGLASMPATRNIPSALLTSLDDNDDALKLVPKHVPVIHKSGAFGDDLAEALSNVFLI